VGALRGTRRAADDRADRAVVIALVLAFAPRRADALGLIASAAAILIALEFGLEHWFYLYIPWFFALVMLVVLCPADGEQPASRPDRLAQEPSGAQRAAVLA
jgi:hypothetical protein